MHKHPHRLHFDLDFLNEKDYQTDLAYAYGELFLSRWFNTTLFHNADNIELIELDLRPLTTQLTERDE